MAEDYRETIIEPPRLYLVHMLVFTLVIAIIVAVLYKNIQQAFMANIGLNGLIIATLLFGIFYTYRMVWRLFAEVSWVNDHHGAVPKAELLMKTPAKPYLLAPMATLLAGRRGRMVLSPLSMRSLLDSLASRLDESRDLARYLVSLLIFLGLLGTFWGLLETIGAIGNTIKALNLSSEQSSTIFSDLKAGLEQPIAGLGISFSSSLFGLAGSLILGFLDLKASQAQNRFYNDLEEWLSTLTDIAGSDNRVLPVPSYLERELHNLGQGMERLHSRLDFKHDGPHGLEDLTKALSQLITQMQNEHKANRQWLDMQQRQQIETQRFLERLQERNPRNDRSET